MLNNSTHYHSNIRKVIVAFGNLFSNISIVREDKSKRGNDQTIQVPIAYSCKEKWVVRIDSDPDLDKHTYTTLPRMAFEITGYEYDSTRKTNKMSRINCYTDGEGRTSTLAPAPYNIEISMYILTKTQEDAMQILEQILPTFSPDYTLSIKAVPDMNIVQDIPIILNSVSVMDEYDGDFQTRRFVTHTLTFTIKTNIYGPVSTQGIILNSMANISLTDPNKIDLKYTASADEVGGNVNENWEMDL